MRRLRIRLPLGLLLLACAITAVGFARVNAADSPQKDTGNGLRVSPVRTDLVIEPGKTQTVNINVTNVTSKPATFQAVINDFTGNPNETGNPAIILDPSKGAPSHGLKKYIARISDFSLQPGQQKTIIATINLPADLPGGGYFGAIRFAPAGTQNDPRRNVNLAGSVGSLILIKVPGDIKEQLTISSFDTRVKDSPSIFFTSNKNITATVRFQNQGNIQEAPFGKIRLKNRSGKVLASYELNNTTPPGNVLPDSIRKFPVPLDKVGKFGQFKVEGNFGYGNSGQLLTASTTFYVVPILYIIIFVLLVLLLLFLIFVMPRIVRTYNRRVLRRAGRR